MAVLEDGTTPFLLRQGEVGRPGCLPEISDVHSRVNAAVTLANWVKKLGDIARINESIDIKGEANIRSDEGKEGACTMLPSLFSAK
jgi:hypothetical protein